MESDDRRARKRRVERDRYASYTPEQKAARLRRQRHAYAAAHEGDRAAREAKRLAKAAEKRAIASARQAEKAARDAERCARLEEEKRLKTAARQAAKNAREAERTARLEEEKRAKKAARQEAKVARDAERVAARGEVRKAKERDRTQRAATVDALQASAAFHHMPTSFHLWLKQLPRDSVKATIQSEDLPSLECSNKSRAEAACFHEWRGGSRLLHHAPTNMALAEAAVQCDYVVTASKGSQCTVQVFSQSTQYITRMSKGIQVSIFQAH